MRVSKVSSTVTFKNGKADDYVADVNSDLTGLFFALSGRLRFGNGGDGKAGENIAGEFQQFTTSATPNAENTIAHTVGSVPIGYLIFGQDKAGDLYQLSSTGTAWTSSNIYLKCSVASVTFLVFLIK
jgi:hypothetical protein